jgi:mannose/fructose/N-acetylgalactosamine-specific phosphotransferase system component IID
MDPTSSDPLEIERSNSRIFRRSFFLETVWNYERMQNIGFVFCIYPVLKMLYPDDLERREAAARNLQSVNTHPSLGPLLVGLTARFERDFEPSTAMTYRKLAMVALAARGDHFFWGHLKPLASICSVLTSLFFFGTFLGSAVLLLIYNIPNMWVRWIGFRQGWRNGLGIIEVLKSPRFDKATNIIRCAITFFAGLSSGLLLLYASGSGSITDWSSGYLFEPVILVGTAIIDFVLLRLRFSPAAIIAGSVAGYIVVILLTAHGFGS